MMSLFLEETDKKALVRLQQINKETKEVERELGFATKIRVPDKQYPEEINVVLITSASIFPDNIDEHLNDIVVHQWKAKSKQNDPAKVKNIENHKQADVSTVVFDGGDKPHHTLQYKVLTEKDLRKKEHKTLFACVFEDEKQIVLQFENQEGSYKLNGNVSKEGFDANRAKGAPVIIAERTGTLLGLPIHARKIIGVLSINSEGDLYPVLFKDGFLDERPSSSDTAEAGPSGIDKEQSGEHLVKYLKESYSKGEWSLILPFPWMEGDRFHIDNLYTSLTITEKGRTDNIEVENMFSPREGGEETDVRRILIEGEAGIGKSTYCKKIAYDWSKDKLEKPAVDLVLVIKCCDLKDGDLWQAIKEQNLPEDLHRTEKAEEVFDYIRVNKHRILLIVDGFDEIPATTETTMTQSIKKLITGQLLSDARVILTSRPERCSDLRKHFDKKLEMTGFSWNDSCHFLKQFCSSSHNAAETISSLDKTPAIKELTRCPLNAAFLCLVLEEKEIDGDFLKSLDIGSLYREMVFCVIKRYCVEKKEQEVQDDTLMDEYHEIMIVLGKIAFNLMKDNLTTFGEKKLPNDSKQILKDIGFLIESKILNTTRPKSTYMFSHSSIKEHFAALYVAECLRQGNIDILTSIHTENTSSTAIGNSNHVQNVYYSLQRFNVATMANLPSSEDHIKLINGLASHLPNDIDVSQAELIRFDFTFSFICELLGNCQGDRVTKVIKEIAIPELPVIVFYLYNGKQALDGFVSLLSQSADETSKVKIKTLRLEGMQAVSSSIPIENFITFSRALGEYRFLKTVYLSFFSNSTDFTLFFDHFGSTSVENLCLQYIPQDSSKDSNIFTILRNLCCLTSLDLSKSSIPNLQQFWVPEGVPSINHDALRVLKLSNCNLTSRDVNSIVAFLRKSTTIEELDLSGTDFSDGIYLDLEGCTLQVLRMSYCKLRSCDVDFIFHSLRKSTTIKELDLSGNDFSGDISLDLEGCTLQVLRMSKCNLKELDLSGIDFSDGISLDLEGCTLQVLKMSKCNLKELDLSGIDFSDGISLDLEGCTLQVLRMSSCNLRSRDNDYIFHSLQNCWNISELDLSGNALDAEFQSSLKRHLPKINIQF